VPLLEPVINLVIGLFLNLLVWLVIKAVKFLFGLARTAVVDHPFLTGAVGLAAVENGWLASPWAAPLCGVLLALGVVRLVTAHPPAEVRQTAGKVHRSTSRRLGELVAVGEVAGETAGRGVSVMRRRRTASSDLPPLDPPVQVTATQTSDISGNPLDERGRKFFAYREAGYGGWLNEHGDPVAEDGAGGWTRITATDPEGRRIVADPGGSSEGSS
jgi:hypothetical protein